MPPCRRSNSEPASAAMATTASNRVPDLGWIAKSRRAVGVDDMDPSVPPAAPRGVPPADDPSPRHEDGEVPLTGRFRRPTRCIALRAASAMRGRDELRGGTMLAAEAFVERSGPPDTSCNGANTSARWGGRTRRCGHASMVRRPRDDQLRGGPMHAPRPSDRPGAARRSSRPGRPWPDREPHRRSPRADRKTRSPDRGLAITRRHRGAVFTHSA